MPRPRPAPCGGGLQLRGHQRPVRSPLLGAFLLMEASGWAVACWKSCCCLAGGLWGRFADLHRPGFVERARRVFAGDSAPPSRSRRPIAPNSRALVIEVWPRSSARYPVARPVPPAPRRAADDSPHPAAGPGSHQPGDCLCRQHQKSSAEVLFSGQDQIGPFVTSSASYTVAALLLLLVCKTGLRRVAERLPRRTHLPRHVHRRVGGMAMSHLPCRWYPPWPWASARSPR